jgi:uncharacterized protein YraI
MFKFILAASLILSSAVALPAHAGAESNTHYVCTNSSDSSLTLRRAPNRKSKQVRQIPTGEGISLIDSRTSSDGFTWYKVSYENSVGWVRSDYVCAYEGGN